MNEKQVGKKKLALGKGIASLLGTEMSEADETSLATTIKEKNFSHVPSMVSVKDIVVNPYQPRKLFEESALRELANSIREVGIIQPIVVSQTQEGKFEIISGERRFRASKMAGLASVPVLCKRVTDREKLAMAIIENVQRSELNCVEEALAYYQLMNEFNLSQEEVAKRVGKERSSIANFLRVLKLPREVVELLQKGELSFGHGKVLAVVKEPEHCTRIAVKVAGEGFSVRQTEELVRKANGMGSSRGEKASLGKGADSSKESVDSLRRSLEQKTGYRFAIKARAGGSGQIVINYSDKREFNEIFDYLMK